MAKPCIVSRIKLVLAALGLAALCMLALVFVGCDGDAGGKGGNTDTEQKILYVYTAEEGGILHGSTAQELSPNEMGTAVTAVELSGYRFVGWSDGNKSCTRNDEYDESRIPPNVSTAVIKFTAKFKRIYTAIYESWEGGRITGAPRQTVYVGEQSKRVTAVPDDGYKFLAWSDGATTAERTDVLNANLSVAAVFRPIDMSYRYIARSGGSVVLSYTDDGMSSTVTATATPDESHDFVEWSDGVTTEERTEKSFMVDSTVIAEFAIKKFRVEYRISALGWLRVNGVQSFGFYKTVEYGDDVGTVKAEAGVGYEFDRWSDGVTTVERTDTNITSNMSVTVLFKKKEYTVSYSATAGGNVVGELTQTVKYKENGTPVTAVAIPGYSFVRWSDGITAAERTDVGVTDNMSVTAEFARNEFSVIYEPSDGGSITGDTVQAVERGSNGTTVVAVADEGYEFDQWSDGVTTAERTDRYVSDDIFVTAQFAPKLIFTLNDDETGYVVKARNGYRFTEIEIPSTHNGLPVTEIAQQGFAHGRLTEITIPNTVKTIGIVAFQNLAMLTEIYIPDSVEVISNGAFIACPNLRSITGMNNVKTIGNMAFGNCTSLGNLVLPATLESLGKNILQGYKNNVYVQMTQEDMLDLNPEWADSMDDTAEIIYTVQSVMYTLNYIAGEGGKIIGGSIQQVAENRDGTIVTAVADGYYEFVGWSDGVQTADRQDRVITSDMTVTAIFKLCLLRFSKISDTECEVSLHDKTATTVVVPARTSIDGKIYTVTKVAMNGFMSATSLTEVVLPDTVTEIGAGAFIRCMSLTSITFSNVQLIGNNAFALCTSLESIVIPETVVTVGSFIFRNCNTQVYVCADTQPESWSENWNSYNENQDVVFGYQD